MTSFELNIIDEKSRAGSEFMFRIAQELQRAFLHEKKARKITQQAIAGKLGTSRAVINRQLQGLENIGARRIGELFWAMGWEPRFCAEKIPDGENEHRATSLEVGFVKPPAANQNVSLIQKIRSSAASAG
ncbi:helix-turn-helix domain-containing protein [Nitrobacter sp. JJSN]|uniref:helix-turn-helix domain-containing protein n=1 Tax=Nitrobacter sp. JJSN TaxID=3453033 RepID=UPI003F75DB1F